jgi:hypothetical protein
MPAVTQALSGKGSAPRKDPSPQSYVEQLRADLGYGRLFRLGLIVAQFALIVAAIRLSNIETDAFELVLTLALGGFLVHHFLPAAWRLGFFAALSVASVPLIFGWEQGVWLLGLGCLLIGLCHLPVALWVRVALVLLAGGAMAAARAQALPEVSGAIPTAIWPILGSMFMFRMIVYLYDLKHRATGFGGARALSYFFMLPNVCFPLFPIVDYKTFQRSAYNEDALRLYATGLKYLLRGLVHLVLYKIVYFRIVIEAGDAVDGLGAARFMIATFLLYLKVSGLFHTVIGLLHMYGFGLPATHHLYLLSSSFTDLWRRINIYWKEFIQKLVFNPAYFWLRGRKFGETAALAWATVIAAVLTWFLHAYQWFWIRGEFPFLLVDLLFWSLLGLALTVNVVLEARQGRLRSLKRPARTVRQDVLLCLKTAGTFTAIVIMWTLWNASGLDELGLVWRAVLNSGPADLAVLVGIPIGLGVIRVVLGDRAREVSGAGPSAGATGDSFWLRTGLVAGVAGGLIAIALQPTLLVPLSPDLATLAKETRERNLNPADTKKLQRGYYEDLGDATRFNNELWVMYGGRPQGWNDSQQTRDRPDAIGGEYVPSTAEVFKGAMRTINSHGMRDREYTLERPADTFRIALIGSSHDAGSGVRDNETYENVVEDRLNRELGPKTGKRYEILNFSVGGFNPTNKLAVIEQRVFRYQPDLILYAAYSLEFDWTFNSLPHLAQHRLLDDFPFLKRALERAQIRHEPGTPLPDKIVLDSKLKPYAEDVLRALLERFRDAAKSHGIRPALLLLETPDDSAIRSAEFDRVAALGRSLELPLLDLQGSFAGIKDRKSLWIAPWDSHSNPQGHRLLADRLYSQLVEKKMVPLEAVSGAARGGGR